VLATGREEETKINTYRKKETERYCRKRTGEKKIMKEILNMNRECGRRWEGSRELR
jgi:hypothetical protein